MRAAVALILFANLASAEPVKTAVVRDNGGWQLLRDGKPYVIKGAGGGASKELLAKIGGNSFRTWGTRDLDAQLDEAQRLGLTVTVGLPLRQDGRGFSYNDEAAVAQQREHVRQEVLKYKDQPAVLAWAIGNEIEAYGKGDNAAVWKAINDIAVMIHQIDPNHPTMTVTAELGGERLRNLLKYCTDVDIFGVNSYGQARTIHKRYTAGGGTKPFVVTEFGPAGIWEIPKNDFGMYPEQTSTRKGEVFRLAWVENVQQHPELCLGGYAFLWGNKQEATSTWFGMLLPDGTRLESVDVITELWTGKPPENRVPKIEPIEVAQPQPLEPGATIDAAVKATDAENDPLKIEWLLHREQTEFKTGGQPEKLPESFPAAIVSTSDDGRRVQVKLPPEPGGYRLFVYVRDDHGGAATANVPLWAGTNATGKK
jgi:hypothetical protein